jgi:hypothetical protein
MYGKKTKVLRDRNIENTKMAQSRSKKDQTGSKLETKR